MWNSSDTQTLWWWVSLISKDFSELNLDLFSVSYFLESRFFPDAIQYDSIHGIIMQKYAAGIRHYLLLHHTIFQAT